MAEPFSVGIGVNLASLGMTMLKALAVIVIVLLTGVPFIIGIVMLINRLRWNIQAEIYAAGQTSLAKNDVARIVKKRIAPNVVLEEMALRTAKVSLPVPTNRYFVYSKTVLGLNRKVKLLHVSGINYKYILPPVVFTESLGQEVSEAEKGKVKWDYYDVVGKPLNFTLVDSDDTEWFASRVARSYERFMKPSGFAEFLRQYGPYIAFGMLVMIIFITQWLTAEQMKSIAGALGNVANVLDKLVGPLTGKIVPAAP